MNNPHYPAGVDLIPGEENYDCENCGEAIDPLAWPHITHRCACDECGHEWDDGHDCIPQSVSAEEFVWKVCELNVQYFRESGAGDIALAFSEAQEFFLTIKHNQKAKR